MSKILHILATKKFWVELVIMTLGMFITACAVYYFLVPSKLIIGTISGLSIVLTNIFDSMGIHIGLSVIIMVINAILLVLAWLLIGHEFGAKTVYTAMILGPLTDVCAAILPWDRIAHTNLVTGSPSVMGDPGSTSAVLCCCSVPHKP